MYHNFPLRSQDGVTVVSDFTIRNSHLSLQSDINTLECTEIPSQSLSLIIMACIRVCVITGDICSLEEIISSTVSTDIGN